MVVNIVFLIVVGEYDVDIEDVLGKGLDLKLYVGDEGGVLWWGFCMVKGEDVKNKIILDFFYFK